MESRDKPILRVYFDRSELREGVVAVGGFLDSAEKWTRFEERWTQVLSSEGVSCFHMTDFETRQGEFAKGWEDARRRKVFIRRLIGVIGIGKPLAISTGMLTSDFDALPASQRHLFGSRPYFLCAALSVISTMRWAKRRLPRLVPIAFVFEKGDEGAGEVKKILYSLKERRTEIDTLLHSVEFEEKTEAVPLQAADFFAYESAKQLLRTAGLDPREMRKSVRRLLEGRVSDLIAEWANAESFRRLTEAPESVG